MPATTTELIYTVYWVLLFPLCWWGAIGNRTSSGDRVVTKVANLVPVETAVAFTVTIAPILVALLLCVASGDKKSWRWPFQKERVLGAFGMFLLLGVLVCVVPMYHAVLWISSE